MEFWQGSLEVMVTSTEYRNSEMHKVADFWRHRAPAERGANVNDR
ncbi:MAG: hypothetical protein QG615_1298 [Nitrospirota bacterium]|nr:hypothetical protein [Nitrospirota bacterium]